MAEPGYLPLQGYLFFKDATVLFDSNLSINSMSPSIKVILKKWLSAQILL